MLVFLDADVRVHADTLSRLLGPLAEPEVAATFGSYDAAPPERSWVSLYKNLAHHFVHQGSRREASTFWAGCGAVRRAAFEAVGGFDEDYERPSIEDVELGYRLRAAGLRIRLVPEAQVTHLKRWTLASWLASEARLLLAAAAAGLAAVALDAPLLAFLARRVSLPFAIAAAGLQVLHRAVGLLGFVLGLVTRPRRLPRATPAT